MKWTLLEMTARVETETGQTMVVAVDASRFDAQQVAEIVGDAVMLVADSDEPREYTNEVTQ